MKIIIWLFVFLSLITGVSARISSSTDLFNLYLGNALIFDFFIILFTIAMLAHLVFKTKTKSSLIIGVVIAILLVLWENTQNFILNDFGFMFWIVLVAFWCFSCFNSLKKKISKGTLFFICILYFLFYLILYPNMRENIPEYFQTFFFWAFIISLVLVAYFLIKWFYKGGIVIGEKIGPPLRKAIEEKKEKIEKRRKIKAELEKINDEIAEEPVEERKEDIMEQREELEREAGEVEEELEEIEAKIVEETEGEEERKEEYSSFLHRANEFIDLINEERTDLSKLKEIYANKIEVCEEVFRETTFEDKFNEIKERILNEIERYEEKVKKLESNFKDFKENIEYIDLLIDQSQDIEDIKEIFKKKIAEKVDPFIGTNYEDEIRDEITTIKEKLRDYEKKLNDQKYLFKQFKGGVIKNLQLIEAGGDWFTIERNYSLLRKMYGSILNTVYEEEAKNLMRQFERVFNEMKRTVTELNDGYDALCREAEILSAKKAREKKAGKMENYNRTHQEWRDKYEELKNLRKELKKYGIEK